MRKDALLGAALLLVAPRAAEGRVELPFVERLAQPFGLHHLRMDGRTGGDRRNAAPDAVLIDMDEQIHADPRRHLVAEGDHFAKFPGRVDMQQRKRRLGRKERFLRDVKHHAQILADGIKHHRPLELRDHLAHDEDRLRLEPAQVRGCWGFHVTCLLYKRFHARTSVI